ncbi:hypothetical protein BH23PSE1_BH23PSE1_11410 [soil metagenome]
MAAQDPGELYSPEPNILERKAAEYLARMSGASADDAGPGRIEAGATKSATCWAVGLAALAGIISGGMMGGMEIWIREVPLGGEENGDWQEALPWWLGFFAVAGVISAIEIAFLYYLAIRGIAQVTGPTGLALGGAGYPGLHASSLARGALEFPNPRVTIFGIDPYAYVPGWQLLAKNIAYKMKVGVSSFLMRVFLRRVAARVAIRGMVPLFAGPLYAAWNAIIIWRIMREGRVRSLGPFAVERVLGELFEDGAPARDVGEVLLQGAAEMIMRGRDAHGNHVLIVFRLREILGMTEDLRSDWRAEAGKVKKLDDAGRARLVDLLALTALVGSSIRRGQRRMLAEVCEAIGTGFDPAGLKDLRERLLAGEEVGRKELAVLRGGAR